MTSRLPHDLQSILPGHKGHPDQVPEIDQAAPLIDNVNYTSNPHLIAFVRHCGCPFAEEEVRRLSDVQRKHSNVYIVIVAHSNKHVVDDWFKRIGEPKFDTLEKVKVIADPEYSIYDKFGIGQLGWTGLFSLPMILELRSLASKGIKNTRTGQGSNRWQNSGGFAIDHGGIVRWKKIASHAGDICDYEEAVKTVVPEK